MDRPQAWAHTGAREFVSFMLFCFDFFEMFEKHVVNATLKTRYQWPELFSPLSYGRARKWNGTTSLNFQQPSRRSGGALLHQATEAPRKNRTASAQTHIGEREQTTVDCSKGCRLSGPKRGQGACTVAKRLQPCYSLETPSAAYARTEARRKQHRR